MGIKERRGNWQCKYWTLKKKKKKKKKDRGLPKKFPVTTQNFWKNAQKVSIPLLFQCSVATINFLTLCAESLCNSGHLVTLRWKFLVQRSGKTADIFDQKCTRQSWSPLALFRPNFFSKKFFKFFFSAKISQFRYLIAYRYAQTRSFAIKLHVRE